MGGRPVSGRYVVGVDGSGPGLAARSWAEARASSTGSELVLVHVRDEAAYDRLGTDDGPRNGNSHVLDVSGSVPEALARIVRAEDVLVIGTGKTGYIHGRVFGFMSMQIVSIVPCSVAVIPDLDLNFRSGVVAFVDHV